MAAWLFRPIRVPIEAVDEFGLDNREGAVVTTVEPGGPAARAGMQPGDVMVRTNDAPVGNPETLSQMVADTTPGASVPIVVVRDKNRRTLQVQVDRLTLGRRDSTAEGFGLTLGDLTRAEAARLRLPPNRKGVLVAEVTPGGTAMRAGMQQGDVILEVGGESVGSAADALWRLDALGPGGTALLLLWRSGGELFLTVPHDSMRPSIEWSGSTTSDDWRRSRRSGSG